MKPVENNVMQARIESKTIDGIKPSGIFTAKNKISNFFVREWVFDMYIVVSHITKIQICSDSLHECSNKIKSSENDDQGDMHI